MMIWIIDFGTPTITNIQDKLIKFGYRSVIISPDEALSLIYYNKPTAIILSGGPDHIYDDPRDYRPLFKYTNLPILGICYGMQVITQTLGGKVAPCHSGEHGMMTITKNPQYNYTYLSKNKYNVWMNHNDCIIQLPPNFHPTFYSGDIIAGMMSYDRPIVAYQFHPEVSEINNDEFFLFFLEIVAKLIPDN